MIWPTYHDGTWILLGDWVRVWVPELGVWHHGIVHTVQKTAYGFVVQVIHNAKNVGVSIVSLGSFSGGNSVVLYKRPCRQCARTVLARAVANLGRSYDLFSQNCEHFASFAFHGEARSETLRAWGTVTAVVLAIGFFGRS